MGEDSVVALPSTMAPLQEERCWYFADEAIHLTARAECPPNTPPMQLPRDESGHDYGPEPQHLRKLQAAARAGRVTLLDAARAPLSSLGDAAIRDAAMLPLITEGAAAPRRSLSDLIARNVAIKAAIVSEDEFETKGLRALLNFGHTIGHAIESCAGYGELFHGEAISLGLRAALFLSERHAGLDPAASHQILDLLKLYQLPLVLSPALTDGRLFEKMARDKKFDQGAIRFVLVPRLGDAQVSKAIGPQDIADAIAHLRTDC